MVTDMSYFGTTDYYSRVANGEVAGRSLMSAMGERDNMGTTVSGEDLWHGNDLTPAPTSDTSIPIPADVGEQMTVVSESTADTSAGTGVQTVRLHYLDATGAEQTEDITMNGTTGVNTVATNIRFVNDMYSLTVGTGGVAADHIKIYKTGTVGLVYNMITQGGNKSLVPNRMVPIAKTLIIKSWHAEEAQGKRTSFRLRSTDMNGVLLPRVFCFKANAYLSLSTQSLDLNIKIPALSIIKVSGWAVQAGAESSSCWWGELIDD
jgi:hypothetical protein